MNIDVWMKEGDLDLRRAQPWDEVLTVPYVLERQGLELDRTAIVAPSGSRTYRELREHARRVAHGLVDLGVEPFDRVAMLMDNELEFIEIEVGIAGARAIMVGMNWRLTERELLAILDKSQPTVIFAKAPFIDNIHRLRAAGNIPYVTHVIEIGGDSGDLSYAQLLDRGVDAPPPRTGRAHEPHEIIFTSGTTGDPKGAVWTNGSLLFNAIQQVMDYHLTATHSTYVMIDLYYIGGRHDLTFPLLYQGGTVHLKPSGGFDAAAILDYIEEHEITHLLWVPAMLYEVLPQIEARGHAAPSIQFVMSGGAPIPRSMLQDGMRLLPGVEFVQVYGLTEGGGSVTNLPGSRSLDKLGSCGRASQNVTIRVARDDGSDCGPGEAGEVLVKGASVSAGYWAMPDRTNQTIVDGWLHTGDIGYIDDDGFLYISGRKKEMIISGGMNIFPAEIEEALCLHPAVSEAAVVGAHHDKWGEQVVAFVKLRDGAHVSTDDLLAHCREQLASYKKPQRITVLEEFPRTASGKVKKNELQASAHE